MEPESIKDRLVRFLREQNAPLSPKEISRLTGINYNTVRARLSELRRMGLVEKTPDGWVAKKT
mgnify:CR=1 FL=1